MILSAKTASAQRLTNLQRCQFLNAPGWACSPSASLAPGTFAFAIYFSVTSNAASSSLAPASRAASMKRRRCSSGVSFSAPSLAGLDLCLVGALVMLELSFVAKEWSRLRPSRGNGLRLLVDRLFRQFVLTAPASGGNYTLRGHPLDVRSEG